MNTRLSEVATVLLTVWILAFFPAVVSILLWEQSTWLLVAHLIVGLPIGLLVTLVRYHLPRKQRPGPARTRGSLNPTHPLKYIAKVRAYNQRSRVFAVNSARCSRLH